MKKSAFQIVMLTLLLIMGCTKDDLITTEQDLFSVEKNNQAAIGEKRGLDNEGWKDISFQLISSINDTTNAGYCLRNDRKILKSGYFEGNIQGFGVIKPNLSPYTFSEYCLEIKIESGEPTWGEEWKYELKITGGKVAISTKDYFYIDINTYLYPWFNLGTGNDDGTFVGTATTRGGKGKFEGFDGRTFMVNKYGSGIDAANLETGMIHLWLHN